MSDLLTRNTLVVNQKAKLIEVNNQYAILDENGTQVGAINEVGQSKIKKVLRVVSNLDQYFTHKLTVTDSAGTKVLELTRPRKLMKTKVLVQDGAGATVGSIVQKNMIGKIRFAYEGPNGEHLGGINAENWRAWNFSIVDQDGKEIGRITKKWAGLAKEMFTTADNYAYEINPEVTGPLRLLGLASAASVDLALKQDDK